LASEKNFQNVDGCRFLDAHETQACTGDNRERGRQPEPARELELELVHGEHRTGEDGDNDSVTDKTPAKVEKGRGSSPEVHGVLGEVNREPEAATGRRPAVVETLEATAGERAQERTRD
jgi:hypothetical protein